MSCLLCSTYYFFFFFFQGIPLPRQTKRTVFRDRPFPIIVVKKDTRRVLLYTNLIGINIIIIIIIYICFLIIGSNEFSYNPGSASGQCLFSVGESFTVVVLM